MCAARCSELPDREPLIAPLEPLTSGAKEAGVSIHFHRPPIRVHERVMDRDPLIIRFPNNLGPADLPSVGLGPHLVS